MSQTRQFAAAGVWHPLRGFKEMEGAFVYNWPAGSSSGLIEAGERWLSAPAVSRRSQLMCLM